MKPPHIIRILVVTAASCVALTGCLNLRPVADPTRYFLLSPGTPEGQPTSTPPATEVVGILPVTVSDYLMQPWMVVRATDTEIHYSDYNKWGESLDKGVQRVLAEDLARRLGPDQIRLNTWRRRSADVELKLVVQRFEVDESGETVLEAQWRISGTKSMVGHRVIRESGPRPDVDPAGAVATMSKALNELSGFIAMDLRQ